MHSSASPHVVNAITSGLMGPVDVVDIQRSQADATSGASQAGGTRGLVTTAQYGFCREKYHARWSCAIPRERTVAASASRMLPACARVDFARDVIAVTRASACSAVVPAPGRITSTNET